MNTVISDSNYIDISPSGHVSFFPSNEHLLGICFITFGDQKIECLLPGFVMQESITSNVNYHACDGTSSVPIPTSTEKTIKFRDPVVERVVTKFV